jgi:hypothetical protein
MLLAVAAALAAHRRLRAAATGLGLLPLAYFERAFDREVALRVDCFVAAWRAATSPVASFGRPAFSLSFVAISAIPRGVGRVLFPPLGVEEKANQS